MVNTCSAMKNTEAHSLRTGLIPQVNRNGTLSLSNTLGAGRYLCAAVSTLCHRLDPLLLTTDPDD